MTKGYKTKWNQSMDTLIDTGAVTLDWKYLNRLFDRERWTPAGYEELKTAIKSKLKSTEIEMMKKDSHYVTFMIPSYFEKI